MNKSTLVMLAAVGLGAYWIGTQGATRTKEPVVRDAAASSAGTITRPTPTQNQQGSCDRGVAEGDVVAVSREEPLRRMPEAQGERIRNDRASEALGRTHYHVIDTSTSVRRLCVDGDWTEVQITQPSWLTHVKGWVPNDSLRTIQRTASGTRVYEESDFYWDSDASKYKPQIVSAVNKIARENSRCRTIDTGTVAQSPTRSSPGDPVFFITCNEGAGAFNVWFRPKDGDDESTQSFAAIQSIARGEAIIACEQAAKERATHPSTVDFSRFMDVAYSDHPSGRATLESSFTARNSFNLEIKHQIRCLFEGQRMIEATVIEAG